MVAAKCEAERDQEMCLAGEETVREPEDGCERASLLEERRGEMIVHGVGANERSHRQQRFEREEECYGTSDRAVKRRDERAPEGFRQADGMAPKKPPATPGS